MGIPMPTAESRAAVGTEFLSPYPPHTHTHGDPSPYPQQTWKTPFCVARLSRARYQLGEQVTGMPGCGVACKDDRTLSGLVCGSEKFTELCYVGLSF